MYPLYSDLMFKYIFGYQESSKFTAHMLESFLNLERGSLKDIKIKNSIKLDRKTVKDKKFETDVLVEIANGELINLEMYTKFDRNSEIKSVMYITSMFSRGLKVADDYNITKGVTQINFVKTRKNKKEEIIREYYLVNPNNTKDRLIPELLKIYVVNVDSDKNIGYNKVNEEFYLWTKLINAETIEEIEEIAKGKK